ncbi:hypothetical protein GOV06_02210 [Candidatus Woesearchaeota archaeon]|nr:hypothetical protein [Candidatus Woesearchaeota archaeon]
MMHEWLIFSLILLGIWFIIYLARPLLRKEILWVSILTAPFGLTEPLFVPEYWSPPSLFNLAARTGFDIESLIFCFAVGGIGAVLYESIFKVKHKKMTMKEMHGKRHRFHKLAIISPIIIFLLLELLTNLNPIYTASIAMFVGGIATILCRPDLKKNILMGGITFTILYFLFFLFINLIFPDFVNHWNLSALSGILILRVPLEEIVFAFTFGMIWAGIYEHVMWRKLKKM